MLYQTLIYINIIGIAVLEMFFGGDVSVVQEISSTMVPGGEQKVEVTINKADITGFAKLQLDLPEGMSVTSTDTKGASFTFKDQKAKFIWMSLPSNSTFKISYNLKAEESAHGSKVISGKLSYIENNERKTFDLVAATIDLGDAPMVSNEAPIEEQVVEDRSSNVEVPTTIPVTSDEAIASESATNTNGDNRSQDLAMVGAAGVSFSPTEGQGGVTGTREISAVSETEFLVTITVEKGEIRGFGKVQEIIPSGFTALEKRSDDAIFTFQDEVVKFVWLNLPAKNTIEIVYKLRSGNTPEGDYSVNGEFSYLMNDETQKASLGSTEFVVGPQPVADETSSEEDTTTETVEEVAITAIVPDDDKDDNKDKVADITPKDDPNSTSSGNNGSSVPAPETGINYKVQITAGHNQVGNAYFASRHSYNGMFSIEHHEGWIKYTTGQYSIYKQARDKREGLVSAGHQFPGPFVTAYNDGVRITVQEALMISNQKWFQ